MPTCFCAGTGYFISGAEVAKDGIILLGQNLKYE